ncbi:hypothetical protein BaRGS_00003162 [Batillaria attramentaria]|uniref:tRNA (guanosine(18)-2'-O)-methyltransferase TARBP1 n=1 Tax=Batillaria attramentaria TaxID=370345 RepID=A0ABD0M1D4_9CAEN
MKTFWVLVQHGLYDDNPAVRKRALYLLKRIIDTCEKSGSNFNPPAFSSVGNSGLPFFWWDKQRQSDQSKVWEDFILILETLDEKQTHVIKPILPRMQSLCLAASWKNGQVLLHTSWLVTLLMRAFHHESTYIVRWAAETVLYMDFTTVPMMQQSQEQFLTQQLFGFLQDLKLYIREVVIASLTTLENFTRGAIECFLTKTVLNLLDKNAVNVEEFLDTLAVMEREESLQRGTQLWAGVVSWLRDTESDKAPTGWTWKSLQRCLAAMVDSYLTVSSVDVIKSVNTRAYMPALKADRAIYLLLTCAKEMGRGSDRCPLRKELCDLVRNCWDELLLYVQRRVLCGSQEEQGVDLDLVIFYVDAVKTLGLLPFSGGVASLQSLATGCVKQLPAASGHSEAAALSPLHQVAAVSLLASAAQIVDARLQKKAADRADGDIVDTDLKHLSEYLWQVCSTLSLDCDVFPQSDRGGSSQRGRRVCQYMESLWRCLHFLVSHRPAQRQTPPILDASLDAFSVSSGESDIPIMQCLELIMPQLVDLVDEEKIVEVCRVALRKVQEEIKSWSYWLKMEAYINMVMQPALLTADPDSILGSYMSQLLERLFEVGAEKSGTLNLVMSRLCQLWQGPQGVDLAQQMVPTIVSAAMFGTVHKKAERLWLDVCMFLETLKEDCSVNEILSCSQKNDTYVRLMAINFLSTLKPGNTAHVTLAMSVLREVWQRYLPLAQKSTFRQYTNSLHHRHKHRLLLLLPLLGQFVSEDTCQETWDYAWKGLVLECHPSVRHNLEWLILQFAHRFPSLLAQLWNCFSEFSSKRNVSLCSLLNIISQLGPELDPACQEEYYGEALPLVLPWSMAHHFNTRLHGQACLMKLWEQCQQLNLKTVLKKHSIVDKCLQFTKENSNSCTVVLKLLDNYFYNCFHFLQDFSMETVFYTLPRLACISDDEWISPDLFSQWDKSWETNISAHSLPLYNSSKKLAACQPGPWRMKAQVENEEDVCESTDGDVQKKIIPWRLMTPDSHAEQEYSYRKKGRKPGGLVLVTSLINKLPNLGGLCRTAEIFGVSEFVIGNLGYLNDHMFQTLSVTAEKWIPITEVPAFRLCEFLEEKKRESYTLVGVEQTANSVSVTKFNFPKKTLLVLGNEKEGIPPELLQQLDVCVEIPQQGIIRSLNVHVSGAILVWEYTRQQMEASH